MEVEAAKALGAGLAVIALAGVGIGIGNIFSSMVASVARNPASRDAVFPIGILGFAKSPTLRVIALAMFAIPAAIAGYALMHGVTKNAIDSTVVLNLLGGAGGLFIGIAAMVNLNALGVSVFSR